MPQSTANGTPADGSNARTPLFAEFAPPTYEEWRDATIESLKGTPIERLVSHTVEGIDLHPLYRAEDAAGLAHLYTLPGQAPFVRGAQASGYLTDPWLVAQRLPGGAPEAVNATLRTELARGLTAVNVAVADGFSGDDRAGVVIVDTVDDVERLLSGLNPAETPVYLRAGTASLPVAALLLAYIGQTTGAPAELRGAIENDPIGVLATQGTLPAALVAHLYEMALLTAWADEHAPRLATITPSGAVYADRGATAVQELAWTLATGVSYLRALRERGLDVDRSAPHVRMEFGVGGNFFMEVAKLRAARMLWSRIVAAFGGDDDGQKLFVHLRSSRWNKSARDPYVNMLRATTESFAGAMGGVQSMEVAPFDATYRTPDEFSRRIARNTQLILQQECNLTRLIDPAGGSWYVEWLTDQVAREAWTEFQHVEAAGGMVAALKEGLIQTELETSAARRIDALATRRDVLVGVNMYANPVEDAAPLPGRIADRPPLAESGDVSGLAAAPVEQRFQAAVEAAAGGASLGALLRGLRPGTARDEPIPPLPQAFAAERFEALRAAADQAAAAGRHPTVFLANLGPLSRHKARADFSRGFFEVGGFAVDSPDGFATPVDAAEAALAANADAVVICATDDVYPELVPPLVARLKTERPDLPVILAGYPKDHVDALRAAGIDEFIHVRADCLAINSWLQSRAGL